MRYGVQKSGAKSPLLASPLEGAALGSEAALADDESGPHFWADRFDTDAAAIADSLGVALIKAEAEKGRSFQESGPN